MRNVAAALVGTNFVVGYDILQNKGAWMYVVAMGFLDGLRTVGLI